MKAVSSLELHFPREDIGDRYELCKVIGRGSYGFVAEAKIKGTQIKVAIKKVTNLFDDLIDAKRILREIIILRKLNHPNLVRIIEIIAPRDWKKFNCIYLVTEYCQGDLRKVFKSENIFLELNHIRSITYQILCGEIIHRDLKPANVLINQDTTVKICDFGLARSVEGLEQDREEKEELPEVHEQEQLKEVFKGPQLASKPSATTTVTTAAKQESKKPKMMKQATVRQSKEQPKEDKQEKPSLNKQLTIHVTTRWYRAPEVILLEKNYNAAIDIWSVGCIFGELVKMMKEVCPFFSDRFPLFPGKYCYPLSPSKMETIMKNGFPHGKQDQLDMIFSTIGTPSEADLSFVSDEKAKDYLRSFPHQDKANFQIKFPKAPKQVIDLLQKTIMFDPRRRLTVDEALNHPFFRAIRDPSKEIVGEPVVMEFEKEGDLDELRLRQLFIEEIKYYLHRKH